MKLRHTIIAAAGLVAASTQGALGEGLPADLHHLHLAAITARFEAGGEGNEGQRAVLWVIRNRLSCGYARTIKGW